MEADTAAIRRFGTVASELAAAARTVADGEIASPDCGSAAAQFVAALRAAVAAHSADVAALGDILEQASHAAFSTADGYLRSDDDAAGMIGT